LTGFWVICPSGKFVDLAEEIGFCAQRTDPWEPCPAVEGTRGFQGNHLPKYTFVQFPGTNPRQPRHAFARGRTNAGKNIVAGKEYLTRQATTLIRFAKVTTDPQTVAALVDKAVDLKSKLDESTIDRSPRAPDVQPEN
jgi:hypothetical protein